MAGFYEKLASPLIQYSFVEEFEFSFSLFNIKFEFDQVWEIFPFSPLNRQEVRKVYAKKQSGLV